MKKYIIKLSAEERTNLEEILIKGSHRSQKVLNALILLNCDEGDFQDERTKNEDIAKVLKISMRKIDRLKQRFVEHGIEAALEGRESARTYEHKLDGEFEAHVIAMSCGSPPEGYTRWSLRLLADKAVELEYIDSVSHETIRQLLKKTNLSLGRKKGG